MKSIPINNFIAKPTDIWDSKPIERNIYFNENYFLHGLMRNLTHGWVSAEHLEYCNIKMKNGKLFIKFFCVVLLFCVPFFRVFLLSMTVPNKKVKVIGIIESESITN